MQLIGDHSTVLTNNNTFRLFYSRDSANAHHTTRGHDGRDEQNETEFCGRTQLTFNINE